MKFYKALEIEQQATLQQIKAAYRKLALIYHPDKNIKKTDAEKNAAEKRFKEISEAYDFLISPGNPSQREIYDQALKRGLSHDAAVACAVERVQQQGNEEQNVAEEEEAVFQDVQQSAERAEQQEEELEENREEDDAAQKVHAEKEEEAARVVIEEEIEEEVLAQQPSNSSYYFSTSPFGLFSTAENDIQFQQQQILMAFCYLALMSSFAYNTGLAASSLLLRIAPVIILASASGEEDEYLSYSRRVGI